MDKEELERRAEIAAKDYQGIVPYCEAFYLHSIIYSAERCIDSFDRYESQKGTQATADSLVSIIQEAVGHAAALSRYFWPSPAGKNNQPNIKKLKLSRGDKLRKSFGLTEESALFNRELRNAWEHFDERLDIYLLKNDAGMFFPSSKIGSHTLADDPTGHIFKLLDIDAECLVLMGEKYFFSPIRDEVKRIALAAKGADKDGARLRS